MALIVKFPLESACAKPQNISSFSLKSCVNGGCTLMLAFAIPALFWSTTFPRISFVVVRNSMQSSCALPAPVLHSSLTPSRNISMLRGRGGTNFMFPLHVRGYTEIFHIPFERGNATVAVPSAPSVTCLKDE